MNASMVSVRESLANYKEGHADPLKSGPWGSKPKVFRQVLDTWWGPFSSLHFM